MKKNTFSGQSLAEFAIVLPMLMLLVMGVFDLGRAIYFYSAIHNAAREAVRYGAVNQCDTAGIIEHARSLAGNLGDQLVVSEPTKHYTGSRADYLVVTVQYTFDTVTPIVGSFLSEGGSVQLESSARQMIEMDMTCP